MGLHSTDCILGVSVAYQKEYIKPENMSTKWNFKKKNSALRIGYKGRGKDSEGTNHTMVFPFQSLELLGVVVAE